MEMGGEESGNGQGETVSPTSFFFSIPASSKIKEGGICYCYSFLHPISSASADRLSLSA
jgi:hypothetical protein